MSDGRRRKTDRPLPWLKVGLDGTELPLSAGGRASKWRVGGWVGGLYVKLKEVGMDGKGTLKMFRKKRELIKTPSISKKSRAGSPGPQSSAPSVSSASLLVSECVGQMTFMWRGQAAERAPDQGWLTVCGLSLI